MQRACSLRFNTALLHSCLGAGQDDGASWIPVNGSGRSAGSTNYSSWVWGPARALRLSYRHNYGRLHGVLHAPAIAKAKAKAEAKADAGATRRGGEAAAGGAAPASQTSRAKGGGKNYMMLNNCNWLCRLDEMHAFDGTFSEVGSARPRHTPAARPVAHTARTPSTPRHPSPARARPLAPYQ